LDLKAAKLQRQREALERQAQTSARSRPLSVDDQDAESPPVVVEEAAPELSVPPAEVEVGPNVNQRKVKFAMDITHSLLDEVVGEVLLAEYAADAVADRLISEWIEVEERATAFRAVADILHPDPRRSQAAAAVRAQLKAERDVSLNSMEEATAASSAKSKANITARAIGIAEAGASSQAEAVARVAVHADEATQGVNGTASVTAFEIAATVVPTHRWQTR
jgi:hypothetical protein